MLLTPLSPINVAFTLDCITPSLPLPLQLLLCPFPSKIHGILSNYYCYMYIQPTEPKQHCLCEHVFRTDSWELDNLHRSFVLEKLNSFPISIDSLLLFIWDLVEISLGTQHVKRCCYCPSRVQATVSLRFHRCVFPVVSIGHFLASSALGLCVLKWFYGDSGIAKL